jgi:ANTAR domain
MSVAEDVGVARASARSIQTADGARASFIRRGAGEPRRWDAARLETAWLELDAQMRRFERAKERLRATIEQQRNGRPQREILHDSAFARLQARLESMPVIEQAKGILMAQQRCGPDEAFDLLRRASQRANIKISVLAAQIVENVASPEGPRSR